VGCERDREKPEIEGAHMTVLEIMFELAGEGEPQLVIIERGFPDTFNDHFFQILGIERDELRAMFAAADAAAADGVKTYFYAELDEDDNRWRLVRGPALN
jgi:hypothetical protein